MLGFVKQEADFMGRQAGDSQEMPVRETGPPDKAGGGEGDTVIEAPR